MAAIDLPPVKDLQELIDRLDQPPPEPTFALTASQFRKDAAKDWASRRGIAQFIHPDNAKAVLPHLPEPGEVTHAALRGDFVLGDLIPAIISHRGRCPDLLVATLSLSAANADTLANLHARDRIGRLTVVCSHYFSQVDKTSVFAQVQGLLDGHGTLLVRRCHAKVICLPTDRGDHFVICGSANLRSSDNTEQICIFNDPGVDAFHRGWLSSLQF